LWQPLSLQYGPLPPWIDQRKIPRNGAAVTKSHKWGWHPMVMLGPAMVEAGLSL
jgi:hypothetical protein